MALYEQPCSDGRLLRRLVQAILQWTKLGRAVRIIQRCGHRVMRCQFVGQLLVDAGVVQDAVRAVVQSRVLFVPNMSQHNAAAYWSRLAASGSVGAKLANGWVRDPPVCWTGRVVGVPPNK